MIQEIVETAAKELLSHLLSPAATERVARDLARAVTSAVAQALTGEKKAKKRTAATSAATPAEGAKTPKRRGRPPKQAEGEAPRGRRAKAAPTEGARRPGRPRRLEPVPVDTESEPVRNGSYDEASSGIF